jgi:hypothetical protein
LSPRVTAAVGVLLAAVVLSSCHTTAGTPIAQKSTSASAGAAPSTVSAAPAPTPKSDEDQVRDTVFAFQDAYNTENWDAYMQLLCNAMREQFTGAAMDMLKKGRRDNGLTQVISVTAKIDGDRATATIDAQNEVLGRQTVDLPLIREDGWKVCKVV